MRFDLGEIASTPAVVSAHRSRWIGFALSIVFAVIAFLALTSFLSGRTANGTVGLGVVLGLCALFVGGGQLIFLLSSPNPTSLTIDELTMICHYASGRKEEFPWTNPKLRVRLYSMEGYEARGVQWPPMWMWIGGVPYKKYLTKQAFDGIVRQAEGLGLRVVSGTTQNPRFIQTLITRA